MGLNPEYTKWSRIVMGLAGIMVMLISVAMWASVEFIREENDNGNENLGRDVGIYIAMTLCGITTLLMVCCAITTNNPYTLQAFSFFSFLFSGMFLTLAGTQVDGGNNSQARKLFISFSFLIGFVLFFSCIAAFQLSKIEDFVPEEEKQEGDQPAGAQQA